MQRRCEHAATTTARRSGYGGRTSEAHAPLAKAGGQVAGARPRRRGRRGGPQDNGGKRSGCCVPRRTRTVPAEIRPVRSARQRPFECPRIARLNPDRPTSFGHSRRVDRLLGTKNVAHDAPLYCGLGQGCRAESAPTPYWLPHRFRARSGRRGTPPGPVRRLRGMRRQCPPAHCVQCSGPTHAAPMEALSRRPDNSARPGARPHGRSTRGARPAGSGAAFRQVRRATGSSRRARSPSASCPPAVRLALPSRPSRPPTSPPSRRTPSTVRPRPSARATIPPYGRLPLNGRDAANYAGFTEVLGRRHIPRGSATCLCGRSAGVRPWGGHGTNAARLDG